MSWRDRSDAEYCDADLYQLLYRDDGVVLGLVMRLRGGEDTYAYVYTAAHDALRRRASSSPRLSLNSSHSSVTTARPPRCRLRARPRAWPRRRSSTRPGAQS